MTRRSRLGLGLVLAAGLAVPALTAAAQPVVGAPPADLFSGAGPGSPEGEVPVRSWIMSGAEFAALPAGGSVLSRGCAPFRDVGSAPEGDAPSGAAFEPDGEWFVLAHRDSRNLLVYDADTRDLIREIPLSGSPIDLAISDDGHWAVTPNLFEDTVSIVDLDSGAEVAVLPVGDAPITVRITPDGSTALVGSLVDADLAVIDLASATELRRIGGLEFAVTLAANFETFAVTFTCANPLEVADASTAVFPDLFNDQLIFVDIDTGTTNAVPSEDSPRNVAVARGGELAVVSHSFGSSATLGVIDVLSQSITKLIPVGTDLWGPVSLNTAGTQAAVAVQNAVRIVDLNTDAVSNDLNTASVNALLTTADGEYALGVGFRGSLISYAGANVVKNLNNFVSTSIGAVSPVDPRAVMLATTFGEDMVVVNTDGASGFLEETRPSGPPPEGDRPRVVAVSADGSRVYTSNQFSQNMSAFDAASMTLLGQADAGRRPGQVVVSPDGDKAVVTNRDDTFVTVVDTATLTPTDVTISTRGDQVGISPDSTYAYIAVVVSDGVWRVNLDTLAVEGPKLATGDMGGVSYTGNQFSGIALSHDGGTLVTCNTYSDSISIIDTAAWSVVATVSVGDFPTAASFSPDDSRIYVTNRDSETVSAVSNNGAGSAVVGTASVGAGAYLSVVSGDGSTLYVMNTSDKNIGVVDTSSFTTVDTIALDETPVGLALNDAAGQFLVAQGTASASSNGEMTQLGLLALIDTATNTVTETICADHFLSDFATDAAFRLGAGAGLGGDSAVFFELAGCYADFNGDTVVDTRDVIAFLNAWNAADGASDCDQNGVIDTRDVICFLNAWNAGC